jgi:addiction module HigA family antidote
VKLAGSRAGQHPIRINDQYRICFLWTKQARRCTTPSPLVRSFSPSSLSRWESASTASRRRPDCRRPGISEIVHGRCRITPDTGLRLSRALGLSERYWINMQTDYDIEAEHDLHEEDLRRVEVLVPRAS